MVFHLCLFSLGSYFLPTITISYNDSDEVVIQVLQAKKLFLKICFCMGVRVLVDTRAAWLPGVELQMVVSCLTQMLESELWSSGGV